MPENSERAGSRVINRRRVLHSVGAAGLAALAGCSGGGGGGDGGGGNGDGGGGNGDGGGGNGDGGGGNGGNGGGGDGLPDGEFTVRLRNWAVDPGIKDATEALIDVAEKNLEEMTDEGTKIDITNDPVPGEQYPQKLKTEFGANNPPGIVQIQANQFGSYYQADRLQDLSEYVTDEYIDKFYDIFTEPWVRDDGRYGLPKDVQVYCMYYNERMFEEAGVKETPQTWDELHQALTAVKENTDVKYPAVEHNDDPYSWWGMKWQLDGRVMNEDKTECVIANEGNVQTMEYIRSLRDDGLLGYVNEVSSEWNGAAIGEEETAVIFAGAWVLPFLIDQYEGGSNEDIKTASMPYASDGEDVTGIYTLSYSVPKGTDNPGINATALQAVESESGMEEWISSGVALSPFKAHRELPLYEEMPRLKTMRDDIQNAKGPVWTYGEHAEEIQNIQTQKLQAILVGENSPREGLEAIQEAVNNNVL
jgi:ABC-type glycerol-3-phosphate transport system substrate-binding protein